MIVLIVPDGDGPGFPMVHGPFKNHEEAGEYAALIREPCCFISEVNRPVIGELE